MRRSLLLLVILLVFSLLGLILDLDTGRRQWMGCDMLTAYQKATVIYDIILL